MCYSLCVSHLNTQFDIMSRHVPVLVYTWWTCSAISPYKLKDEMRTYTELNNMLKS